MSRIGAFEAKTHLPRLLRRVQAGERFVITRHDRPIAELIPFRAVDEAKVRAAIEDLKDFQRKHTLDGLSIREMIEEGRKH
ncbi:MAG: type II toxin-antitoxin system prevent-host-death family antitoxin [Gemmatimonadetes bacterium]|nr:type II toxin-antitoxin system prevent-host-death family antitoxin [Gemmatimonadota bacterium]